MKEQLYINNIYVPLSKSINPSIVKSITDVENPDKRKATFTKTINIPASPEVNQVFGMIFDLNTVDCTFDVTTKANAVYLVNDEPVMEGYCQLKNINQIHRLVDSYDIVIGSGIADLFGAMGDAELTELGDYLDQWNHPFTAQLQEFSWDTQVYNADSVGFVPFAYGTGYVYPLIDYGKTSSLTLWNYYEMACALYLKEYIDAIQDYTNITFESTFFNSAYFKRMIVPASPDTLVLTDAEILDRQFEANTPQLTSTGTTTSAALPNNPATWSTPDTIIFTNELTDPSALYNNGDGKFTCIAASQGYHTINALLEVSATFTPSTGVSVVTTSDIEGYFMVFKNGTQIQSTDFHITYDDYPSTYSIGARSTAATATYPDTDYTTASTFSQVNSPAAAIVIPRLSSVPNRYLLSISGVYLATGDYIEIKWKGRYVGLGGDSSKMFRSALGTYYTGSATIDVSVGAFYNKYNNTVLPEGATLDITKIIPKKVKQKDFFMSIVKAFNLWLDVHPTKTNTLIVEPREDFLGSTVLDIQSKLAHDRELEISPMGKIDAKDYLFTYKQDKDYLNQKYQAQYDQIYGQREVVNTNDFVSANKKIELLFSPTPLSAPPNSDMVLSTIIGLDAQNAPKTIDHNVRLLYYGGLLDCSNVWTLNSAGLNPNFHTQYPYAGHFDHPFLATEDINFGLVKEVYYDDNITPIQVTNNNLYNKYYSKMLNEYTDKESKVVTGYFNISPADFKNWTFDKLYYFENSYFRLQKIDGYNPTSENLTKCVFLYINTKPVFTRDTPFVDGGQPLLPSTGGGSPIINDSEYVPIKGGKSFLYGDNNNTSGNKTKVDGTNNYVASDALYINISGNSNEIHSNTKNVIIQGDSNIIQGGLENVTLINTDGITVEESNVTYIDGKKLNSESVETTSFVIDDSIELYYLDGTSGVVWGRLNNSTSEFIFKCIDATNRVYVDAGAYTIDGTAATTLDFNKNDSYRLRWNQTDETYYIIN